MQPLFLTCMCPAKTHGFYDYRRKNKATGGQCHLCNIYNEAVGKKMANLSMLTRKVSNKYFQVKRQVMESYVCYHPFNVLFKRYTFIYVWKKFWK